jgi:hypothetical protein
MLERGRKQGLFFVGFASVAVAIVLVGFGRTFLIPLARREFTAPWYVYAHGILFLSWFGLLIAQSLFAAAQQMRRHRQLGWTGAALIPIMVGSIIVIAVLESRGNENVGHATSAFAKFSGNFIAIGMFAGLATTALLSRRHPEVHKRLMLISTLVLLDAALGRIPIVADYMDFVRYGLLGAIAAFDLATRRAVHFATFFGGLVLAIPDSLVGDPVGTTLRWLQTAAHLIARGPS